MSIPFHILRINLHNYNKDGAHNYKISETSITNPSSENWIDILEHRDHVLLEDFEIFNDHWVVTEREKVLQE